MRQRLTITMDPTGLPSAEVPFPSMWDLVEYLSYQRVVTNYQYHASHFSVTFPRLDAERAQRLLDEWVHAASQEMAGV
jgi:GTPase SAR1 family protein